jgi:hypothetical protein
MMSPSDVRRTLLERGRHRIAEFCAANVITAPAVLVEAAANWRFPVCAYYRPRYIAVCLERCALPGTAGRAWSWPGYSTDRTLYGVLAHELGHHVDYHRGERRGAYWSEFGAGIRAASGEALLTSYCPNDAEWFAEMFRLFVTNAALLAVLRPRTWQALLDAGFLPVSGGDWWIELGDAPERYRAAVQNKSRVGVKSCLQGKRESV